MRNGQKTFRNRIMRGTKQKCEATQSELYSILDACHIKSYSICSEDEKMDSHNSLLLLASIHRAFDSGFISFDNNGKLLCSPRLDEWEIQNLGLMGKETIIMPGLRKQYMQWHRENIFKI